MDFKTDTAAWEALPYEEKNRQLYLMQRRTLRLFLERGAISQAEHDRSLAGLQREEDYAYA